MFKLQAASMGGGSIAAIVLLTICLGMDLFIIFLSIYGFLWIFTLDLLTLYQKAFFAPSIALARGLEYQTKNKRVDLEIFELKRKFDKNIHFSVGGLLLVVYMKKQRMACFNEPRSYEEVRTS